MEKEVFDSLNYAKDLESAGFTRLQAEKQVGFMGKIISDHLATKTYLDDRLTELRNHFEIRFKDQLNEINNTIDRKFTFHTTIISAILGLTLAIMGLYLHYLATLIEKMAN